MSPHAVRDTFASSPWTSQPIHTERHLRVITIGAGASGLLVAYKLQRSFQNFSLTVYDKNDSISGTWTENRYPGCACDIPAHIYTYTFFPNPDFTHVYSGSAQIKKYFEHFAATFDLGKYIKLQHRVTRCEWDENRGEWNVDVEDLVNGTTVHDTCDILIDATGVLNDWKWPDDVQGLDTFQGDLLHTAACVRKKRQWLWVAPGAPEPQNYDLRGKKVGMLGNGSSAIQVLPAIQPIVDHLTSFIRGPTWISTPFATDGQGQREFSEEEREQFRNDPAHHLEYRKAQESSLNKMYAVFLKDSSLQAEARAATAKIIKSQVRDPVLADQLTPTWSYGCRRITPGPGYLESLQAENVTLVQSGVTTVMPDGCVLTADGNSHGPFDTLVCATGFATGFRPRFPIIGLGGRDLRQEWESDAKGYFALAAAGMPNYFLTFGPNSPIGNGPVLTGLERSVEYILRCVDRWQTENIHSLVPKEEAVEELTQYTDWYMSRTVWNDDCRSWYKKHSVDGRITPLWPGSTLHYVEAIREPRWEDWDIQYNGNRFLWLGNGFSQVELDQDADIAWYVRNEDEDEHYSRSGRRKAITSCQ